MGSLKEPAPCKEGGIIPTIGGSEEMRRNDDCCSKSNIACADAVGGDSDDDGSFQCDKNDVVQLSTEANDGARESSSAEVIVIYDLLYIAMLHFKIVKRIVSILYNWS